jgi:membrane protease YdiL (CAAX protease family)
MEAPAIKAPLVQPIFRRRSTVYLGILLFLRFPVLLSQGFLSPGVATAILLLIYTIGTYLVTALLIWSERDRLRDFNIDTLALAFFALGKPVQVMLGLLNIPGWPHMPFDVAIMAAGAVVLVAAWLRKRQSMPGFNPANWIWLLIAVLIGTICGVLFALSLRNFNPEVRHAVSLADFFFVPLIQLMNAATYEEPLFRGFLWGYLRKLGWRDLWIWLFQAFLFWFGHLYYLFVSPFSLWIIVPLGGLLLGWLAWRTRSVAVSMVGHGFINGIAGVVQFMA